MKVLAIAAVLLQAVAPGGCFTPAAEQKVPLQPVTISVDTLCLMKKRSWSVDDTPETVRAATAFNAGWDRKCAKKPVEKKAAPTS